MFLRKVANFIVESLFNKVAGLQVCNFIKNKFQHRCFLAKFAKFLKHLFWRTSTDENLRYSEWNANLVRFWFPVINLLINLWNHYVLVKIAGQQQRRYRLFDNSDLLFLNEDETWVIWQNEKNFINSLWH